LNALIAGPWLGEFGWELFGWHAYIRYLAKTESFQKIITISRDRNRLLYEDFSDHILNDERTGKCSISKFNNINVEYTKQMKEQLNEITKQYTCTWIYPNDDLCFSCINSDKNSFIQFGKFNEKYKFNVIFHLRNVKHTNSRNYSEKKWEKIIKWCMDNNLKIATIGLSSQTLSLDAGTNLKDISLKTLSDVLYSSQCIVGPSSGPMHFATLCKCPQIVWTDNSRVLRGKHTNRQRYENLWNPFNIKTMI
jgi:ADP-heptose:LPS heptosyltransferase